jgi:hypothetical protein
MIASTVPATGYDIPDCFVILPLCINDAIQKALG